VATICTDQLEICGSVRVYRPAMAEIHALGLAEITRFLKRYVCMRIPTKSPGYNGMMSPGIPE